MGRDPSRPDAGPGLRAGAGGGRPAAEVSACARSLPVPRYDYARKLCRLGIEASVARRAGRNVSTTEELQRLARMLILPQTI